MQQNLFERQTEAEPPSSGVQVDPLVSVRKLVKTKELIECWVKAWGVSNVVVSFSGGKDSTVLLHIARSLYPSIMGVFSNTGLEYSEIVEMAKTTTNIDIVRPIKPFHKVIAEYGWPVISKQVARFVSDCQNANEKNQKTVNLRLTGITSSGKNAPSQKLPECWKRLIAAPFKISDVCCGYLKKQPLERYYKKHGFRPMVAVMRSESMRRDKMIAEHGCNMYDIKHPISYPLADWTDDDIWAYIRQHNIPYASVYDKGEKRTGCVFCMFGIMHDRERFIRLKRNSPKQWDYIINKLGAAEVLDYIGVAYE